MGQKGVSLLKLCQHCVLMCVIVCICICVCLCFGK